MYSGSMERENRLNREYYRGQNFWDVNSKECRVVYPINDEIIRKAEAILKVKFPSSFIDLMKEQNGGKLTYPSFFLPPQDIDYLDEKAQQFPSIEPIHFEKDDISILSSNELLETFKETYVDDFLLNNLVVLWTDCHHWLVFDYRNRKEDPELVYIVENYASENISWTFIKVADSFEEFLKNLYREIP